MSTVRYTTIQGEVLAEKRSGVRSQYVPDALGSTVALLNNAQTPTDTFAYYPYGSVASHAGSSPTPYQFVGTLGYYADASGKTYVRARYLDSGKGRWLTQDPIGFDGGDYNLYRYVENNPISGADPSGLQPEETDDCLGNQPTLIGGPKIVIKPVYGKYCGPQTVPGHGKGIDPLDECCAAHDGCFANAKPPCTALNQWTRKDCKSCNATLCGCAKNASCNMWTGIKKLKCKAVRRATIIYACNSKGGARENERILV